MDLWDLAARQHSAFSRSQARMRGVTDDRLRDLVARRFVTRAAPEVYVLRGVAPTWRQRLMVATLSIPGAMASHRAAARLWGLDGFETAPIEILVVRGRKRARAPRATVLHETMDLKAKDLDERDGIPCTSMVRTLVDLPAVVHEFKAGVALDQVHRRDQTVLPRVLDRHREVARRGRNGTVALRELLAERGHGELVDSGFERKALRLIARSPLPRPVTQHHVVDRDFQCWLDIAWPDRMVAMECHSYEHHSSVRAVRRDALRRRRLGRLGWTVREYSYHEVTRQGPMVVGELSELLL